MNLEQLKAEFDADLASMSEKEFHAALESAGFVLEDPKHLLEVFWGPGSDVAFDAFNGHLAANSNELALAA